MNSVVVDYRISQILNCNITYSFKYTILYVELRIGVCVSRATVVTDRGTSHNTVTYSTSNIAGVNMIHTLGYYAYSYR